MMRRRSHEDRELVMRIYQAVTLSEEENYRPEELWKLFESRPGAEALPGWDEPAEPALPGSGGTQAGTWVREESGWEREANPGLFGRLRARLRGRGSAKHKDEEGWGDAGWHPAVAQTPAPTASGGAAVPETLPSGTLQPGDRIQIGSVVLLVENV